MHTLFHGWQRMAGVAALVIACALAGLWWPGFSAGAAQSSNTFMGGILTVRYPMYPFTPSRIECSDITGRVRMDWGRGEHLTIEVENSKMAINGQDYGSIRAGDSIFINAFNGMVVIVGGETRTPRNIKSK